MVVFWFSKVSQASRRGRKAAWMSALMERRLAAELAGSVALNAVQILHEGGPEL